MQAKNMGTDLTSGSVMQRLIVFATPLFLSNLLQAVYNMVDMIVLGQFAGSAGLSGVSVGGDIMMFVTCVAMGFSNAGQVLISQLTGAGQREKVSRLIGTMFTFLFILAVSLSAIFLIFKNPLLDVMNTPAESWNHASDYVVTSLLGLVFIFGYNVVSAILRGMGDSKHPFMFIAIAAVINLVLDIVFIGGFNWGAFGAAFATVIGQAFSFICAIVLLYRRRAEFGFDFKLKSFAVDKELFPSLLKLGVPMCIQYGAVQITKIFVNSWINSYGVVVSAVSGIGTKLTTITNLVDNSTSTAASSMIGQSLGAEKYERVPKIIGSTFLINSIFTAFFVGVLVIFPNALFGIFTNDAEVLAVCHEYIPVAVTAFISGAFRSPFTALINGSGNSKLNLVVAALDGFVVRVGLSVVLGLTLSLGYMGFWFGNAVAGYMPFFIGGAYLLSGTWKRRSRVLSAK